MPFKKPKNGELTFGQSIFNKIFNSTRVIIEHANSGIKRLRMLKDTIRIHDTHFRDQVMAVACGLHNLRVKSNFRTVLSVCV
jgi:DDE superfamily endonuclease